MPKFKSGNISGSKTILVPEPRAFIFTINIFPFVIFIAKEFVYFPASLSNKVTNNMVELFGLIEPFGGNTMQDVLPLFYN